VANARLAVLLACAALAAGTAGCAAKPDAGVSAPGGAPRAAEAFPEGRSGSFHSGRFELLLELPGGRAWRVDDHGTPWLVATHEPTRSTLHVRSWNEDQVATRHGCYARARAWKQGLPDIDAPGAIRDEVRTLDAGVEARVVSGVIVPDGSSRIAGFSVAVGASARKCIVMVYQTEIDRPANPEVIAERLAVVSETVVAKVRFDRTLHPARATPGRP
jgi:hypothetical protein